MNRVMAIVFLIVGSCFLFACGRRESVSTMFGDFNRVGWAFSHGDANFRILAEEFVGKYGDRVRTEMGNREVAVMVGEVYLQLYFESGYSDVSAEKSALFCFQSIGAFEPGEEDAFVRSRLSEIASQKLEDSNLLENLGLKEVNRMILRYQIDYRMRTNREVRSVAFDLDEQGVGEVSETIADSKMDLVVGIVSSDTAKIESIRKYLNDSDGIEHLVFLAIYTECEQEAPSALCEEILVNRIR